MLALPLAEDPHELSITITRRRPTALASERTLEGARAIVMQHGWNSTSHQALARGLHHWFSPSGDAVVAYARHAGVALVAGAPVAAAARLADVAADFERAALAAGLSVCYFAAEERMRLLGGRAACLIGMQPVWNPVRWAERFDASASLRAQRNRAANKGVVVVEEPGHAEASSRLAAVGSAWLASKRLPPLGFLAHTDPRDLPAAALADRRLFVATTGAPRARPIGYLTACPVPGRAAWLIDKVVRHPAAPNGTVELLLDVAMRRLGVETERVTLGLTPLARPAPTAAGGQAAAALLAQDASPAWLRAAERVAHDCCRGLYDFSGLYEFRRKLRPDAWEPVYLLTPGRALDARDCLAIAAAFARRRQANRGSGRV